MVRGPALSGTGMKMAEAIEALSSFVGGKQPGEQGRMYSDLPYIKDENCMHYLSRYLNLSIVPQHEQETIVCVC